MSKKRVLLLAAAALLAGLGLVCLLSARAMLRCGGDTEVSQLAFTGGSARWSVPADATEALSAPAVLLLTEGMDTGSRDVWTLELSRRGVAVLALGQTSDAGEAWAWLTAQARITASRVAVIAAGDDGAAALALASADTPPAALVLLDGAAHMTAVPENARNVLTLTEPGVKPDRPALTAYLGCDVDQAEPDKIFGTFSSGSARALKRSGASPRSEGSLLAALDWLGSALGHRVELHDDDLIYRTLTALRLGAPLCWGAALLLSGGALLRRKPGTGGPEM